MSKAMKARLRKMVVNRIRLYTCSPIAEDVDAVLADVALLDEAQTITADIADPDVPRSVTIKGTKAGATLTGNVVIHGRDVDGNFISETLALSGDTVVESTRAFAKVTYIEFPVYVTDGDIVDVGLGAKLGLPDILDAVHVLSATLDGAKETTAPTCAGGDEISECTVELASTLDGSEVQIVYLAKE